jgi:hypothetical protein
MNAQLPSTLHERTLAAQNLRLYTHLEKTSLHEVVRSGSLLP